jgi:hypothetical protein
VEGTNLTGGFRETSSTEGLGEGAPGLTVHALIGSVLRGLVLAGVIGVVLGVLGPFGTYGRMETGERLIFWVMSMVVGVVVHAPVYWVAAVLAARVRLTAWLWVPASAVVAAAPMTLMVNGVASALFGDIALDSFASLYPLVLSISLPVQMMSHLLDQRRTSASNPATDRQVAQDGPSPAPAPGPTTTSCALVTPPSSAPLASASPSAKPPWPGFLASLPGRLGRELVCLEMEDHYLRVHTAAGNAMIHHRMGDAEAALVGVIDGMRVHRSWWVARAAVSAWQRDGKTLTLTLVNGQSVPVARDRQPLVKAAGWLD